MPLPEYLGTLFVILTIGILDSQVLRLSIGMDMPPEQAIVQSWSEADRVEER